MREGTGGREMVSLVSPWHWRFGQVLLWEMVSLISELTEICNRVLRQLKKKKSNKSPRKTPPIYNRAGGIIIAIITVMIIG